MGSYRNLSPYEERDLADTTDSDYKLYDDDDADCNCE